MNDSCGSSDRIHDSEVFPYRTQQGGLSEHWYPVAFVRDVKRNQMKRRVVLGVPVLIWRNIAGELRVFVDVCPHRQAQLSLGTVNTEGVTCPYHGWRFGFDGRCNSIPIAPKEKMPRGAVALTAVTAREVGGMIWVWMGASEPTPIVEPFEATGNEWRFVRNSQTFDYDLDDLVENFMDFAHTPVVHPGLIRGMSKAQDREVKIQSDETSVKAIHEPVDEQVGFLSGLVVPRGKVHHSDEFLMPGNVRVEYGFGSEMPSFVAFLGMTPVAENKTIVLVTLGIKFGWANPLIALALPLLIRKVLAQDNQILKQQRGNLDLMGKRVRKSLESDSVDAIVRALRSNCRDPSLPRPKPGTRRMLVRL
jgi:phenylpropionate dioxygenase-like ring-hydroxylating dioxygenase large terminal subunit